MEHRIFRDHLRRDDVDRALYASVKRSSADAANAEGETVMQYNARKGSTIREIYARAFLAAGVSPFKLTALFPVSGIGSGRGATGC